MSNSHSGRFENADVDTSEELVEIPCRNIERLWVTFTVTSAALSGFTVDFKVNSGGDWASIGAVAGDYTSPEGPILGASGDLTVAAADGTVHFINLDVRGVHKVRLQAAGTSSAVSGHWGAM
jgi:hypothetical protein